MGDHGSMERNIGRTVTEHGGRGREGEREKLKIGDAAPDLSTGSDPNSDLLGNSVSKSFPGSPENSVYFCTYYGLYKGIVLGWSLLNQKTCILTISIPYLCNKGCDAGDSLITVHFVAFISSHFHALRTDKPLSPIG